MDFESIASANSATRAGGYKPYPGDMRRLILVVAVVLGVRGLLAYRAKKLAAGEAELEATT
jgi:hypothetical protein